MDCRNELVVKSNKLVEASYRLTLNEQRIVLLAITEGRKEKTLLSEATLIEIKATDYAKTYYVPLNKAYEQMKEASSKLYNRSIVFHDIHTNSGKDRTIPFRWISEAPYIDGAGIIQLRFSHRIIPYISRLEKEFTPYRLEKVANMSSAHAIRMYELMVQWGSIGKREVELEWLRKTLMVTTEYIELCDFKKRVIDVAISQINKFSDITASYNQRKTGRVVTHFIFKFKLKDESKPDKPEKKAGNHKITAPPEVLDESRAKMKTLVIEFLSGNDNYKRLYAEIPVDQAWHVESIRNAFLAEFNEWRQVR